MRKKKDEKSVKLRAKLRSAQRKNDSTIGVESQTVSRCRFRCRPRLFCGGSRSCGSIEGALAGCNRESRRMRNA